MLDFERKVQIISYLAGRFGDEGVEIIKIIKMIFLIDIYSMRNYGFSISGDKYFGMQHGPVASFMYDVVEQDNIEMSKKNLEYIKKYIRRSDDKNSVLDKIYCLDVEKDLMSEIDIEAVDLIFDKYKDYSPEDLIELTHKFSAWNKHEDKLNNNNRRFEMNVEDFLKNDGDLQVSPKKLKNSEIIYKVY